MQPIGSGGGKKLGKPSSVPVLPSELREIPGAISEGESNESSSAAAGEGGGGRFSLRVKEIIGDTNPDPLFAAPPK